ncbi:MAG TPA: RluA family pseudouridine synthase [Clostridia bacterium]|nr:RluA family pseudouridine synthase [Clostridia bacterium]
MQSVEIPRKFENMKVENVLQSLYPRLSYNTLQKAFRKKDIKVNGIRVGRDHIVMPGDRLEVYIVDDLLYGLSNGPGADISGRISQNAGTSLSENAGPALSEDKTPEAAGFGIVYEDMNILIVNKAQGIAVHPDKDQPHGTLIDLVRAYLRQKAEASGSGSFQPSLCHRLDRNTGGLVIIAKDQESHDIILEKIEAREIKKYYQCLVKGKMERNEAKLRAYLWKDAGKSRVFINDRKTPGAAEIITGYKVLGYNSARDVSKLEVELVTGRTHQIRAHLAYIGHPIIGDGKYGKNEINRAFGLKQQALWACRIKFDFAGNAGKLDYLKGKDFLVEPGFPLA